jgi:hypothetical protein
MPRRSTGLTRYLRQTGMNVSRNVQDLFGTTESAIVTQPDPTPSREDPRRGQHSSAEGRRSRKGDRLPPRERRGRD